MGMWTGIKHAINSSLGTKDFKPLDKMIRDSYYVYASDDLLKTLYDKTVNLGAGEDVLLTTIGTMGVPGVIKLHIEVNGDWGGSVPLEMYIGVEGNLKNITSITNVNTDIMVEVKKGDKIQFYTSTNIHSSLKSIKITAHGSIGSAPDTGIFIE